MNFKVQQLAPLLVGFFSGIVMRCWAGHWAVKGTAEACCQARFQGIAVRLCIPDSLPVYMYM